MMLSEEDFWKRIKYSPEDRSKGENFIKYRGLDAHIYILEYLESIKKGKISYAEIATAMRYDKRIRRIVYKYIGFLEEYMRSYIANAYRDNVSSFNHTPELDNHLKEAGSLFAALEGLTLGELCNQVKRLSAADMRKLFPDCEFRKWKLDALCNLRNQVSHNQFLLNMTSIGQKGSLHDHLNNLYCFLPEPMRNKFKTEIDKAGTEGKREDFQTKWVLVKTMAVELDDNVFLKNRLRNDSPRSM